MEWMFIIRNYRTDEIYVNSAVCKNKTYETDKEALKWGVEYAKENSLKNYLICIYRRNKDSAETWDLRTIYNSKLIKIYNNIKE